MGWAKHPRVAAGVARERATEATYGPALADGAWLQLSPALFALHSAHLSVSLRAGPSLDLKL